MKNPTFKDSELFPFLKNISEQKIKDLEYFMHMPSNPSSKEELRIARYILNCVKHKNINTNSDILAKFFSFELEDIKKWRKVRYRIQHTFLRYLAMRKLENHPLEGILLAEVYKEHQLDKKMKSEIKRQQKRMKKRNDPNKSLYDYWLLELAVNEQRSVRVEDKNLVAMERKLDDFFLEKKIRSLLERNNRKDITNYTATEQSTKQDAKFLDWAALKIEDTDSMKVKILYQLYHLFKTVDTIEETEAINKARGIKYQLDEYYEKTLKKDFDQIDTISLETLYDFLLNFYIKRINSGRILYAEQYLDCILKILDRNFIFPNRELPATYLKNTIGTALIYKDIASAWSIISSQKSKPSYQKGDGKDVIKFLKASIYICERKYKEAYKEIPNVKFKDQYHDLDALILKLQIEYSIAPYDATILRNIGLVKKRTQRHKKISDRKRKFFLAFLDVMIELVKRKEIDLNNLRGKVSILKIRWLKDMIENQKRD